MEGAGDGFLFSKGHTRTPELESFPQVVGVGESVSHPLPTGPVYRDETASDLVRAKDHVLSTRQSLKLPPGSTLKEGKASRVVPGSLGPSP